MINHLDIHAPKLIWLGARGVFKSLSIRYTRNIQNLFLYLDLPDELDWPPTNLMSNFFVGMKILQEAAFGIRFNKLLASSGALLSVPTLQQLRKLTFHEVHLDDVDEFLCLSRLLENAPELKELKISLKERQRQLQADHFDIEAFFKDCSCDRLQRFEFSNITGTKLELKLVEIVLRCSPVLENMCVVLMERVETADKLSVMMQLLSFCRASAKAKVEVNI